MDRASGKSAVALPVLVAVRAYSLCISCSKQRSFLRKLGKTTERGMAQWTPTLATVGSRGDSKGLS